MTNKPHRPESVQQRDIGVISLADPVTQHEGGDSASVQPAGHLQAFLVRREYAVAATGIDDDSGAGRAGGFGQVHGQLRTIDSEVPNGAGRTFGPQRESGLVHWLGTGRSKGS